MNWKSDLKSTTGRSGIFAAAFCWFTSPAFKLLVLYRISFRLRCTPRIGKALSVFFWRWAVAVSGCYLSPKSMIGSNITLPHPTGIVIGDGVIIGSDVTIYQNVTLGRSNGIIPEYPIIEDNVTVYSGAVVIGNIRVGKNSIIAANSVVLKDVPPFTVFGGIPGKVLKILSE